MSGEAGKNTKASRLKRMDAVHKAYMIRDEVEKRIQKLTNLIPELEADGKSNEHIIAVHRRSELEDLRTWISDEVVNKTHLGTKEPLKIWDVLKYGKDMEVYEATNTIGSWDGTQVQVQQTLGNTGNHVLVFYTIPRISNGRLQIGGIVDLVGAVTQAEWVCLGKKGRATPPARVELTALCFQLARMIDYVSRKDSLPWNAAFLTKYRLDIEEMTKGIIEKMEQKTTDFIQKPGKVTEKYQLTLLDLPTLLQELIFMRDFVSHLSDIELVEKSEQLLCLIYYFHMAWWGEEEWDERIRTALTEDEMIAIASEVLTEYELKREVS